jgi:PPOX class probable F420-dependent enzyme
MDLDQARTFVKTHHRAVLATRAGGDRVQQTPVLVAADAEGRFVVSSRETAYKTRNLRRDPRAQLCVFTDRFFGDWVSIEGDAEVLSLPDALDGLVEYYRRTAGEHHDWDDYKAAMERDRRVLIRITAARVGPDRQG